MYELIHTFLSIFNLYVGCRSDIMAIIRYIVDLPSDIADAINRFIESGRYRSVQDFLAAAASNQLHIEQHGTPQGLVFASTSESIDAIEGPSQHSGKLQYQLLAPDFGRVQTVAPPEPNQVAGELFGLWNKFFPVKITARVFANILKGDGSYIPLDSAQERAADVARQLGRAIVRKEKDLGRKRGDMIATALPWKREEFKAKTRFKTHFVGYVSRNGIEGAPAALRFVNITRSNGAPMIGLTAAGLKFASLTNPVIDQEDYAASLSQHERGFLTDHIRVELPAEAQLMRSALQAVAAGATSPTGLHAKLHELKPKLNETQLVTLRSGLLSRMYELDLMRRTRDGLTMIYETTPQGQKFLKED